MRALGVLSLTAISVNTIIGAGIFALPGTLDQLLGPASPIAYLAAGSAVLLIALCFAEAGSRFESSGGPYIYALSAFGGFAGFEVAWMYLLARLTALAAVSNTFSAYLGYLWPPMQHGPGRLFAITVMIGAITTTHMLGVRSSELVNNIFTVGKLLPLMAFCVAGLVLLDLRGIFLKPIPGAHSLQQASLLLMFALGGFESASIPSEEVIKPTQSVPAALLSSVGLVVVLFLLIQVVAMAALPGLATSGTPLASAARSFLGPAGGLMLTAGAVLSTAGTSHANLFTGSRLVYALGRDGQLPSKLAWLHPSLGTPGIAILSYATAGWILAVSSAFASLAALSALARVLMYSTTCLAVPILRRRMPVSNNRAFVIPGGGLIAALALGVCAWLLAGSSADQVTTAAAALTVGAFIYGFLRYKRGVVA
ncbi:MAG: amino acid permease [Acidobacteria bacterium Pan2503]|uniref:Arginine/agmatine antiporter n=1 Tax=Candidatus Acidiferrum panamense TaxID=2741543 RepID=A0A7V8SWD8_9BACT|nr:amino acid permease [Candidatus Acidoferrum panamensis]